MTDGWKRPGARPLVLGHRGARHAAPENTLAAFELARHDGADGVELDVRLDENGGIIVLHDRTLERVSEGRERRDVELVPTAELFELDLGNGARVPELAEVLAWAAGRDFLVNVELKHDVSDWRRLVEGVTQLIRAQPSPGDWLVLSSFHPEIVWRLARLLLGVRVAWLVHKGQRFARNAFGYGLLGARAVHPEHVLVTPGRLRRWRHGDTRVNTWTVNDPDRARELAAFGVDGIISDEPGKIREALDRP